MRCFAILVLATALLPGAAVGRTQKKGLLRAASHQALGATARWPVTATVAGAATHLVKIEANDDDTLESLKWKAADKSGLPEDQIEIPHDWKEQKTKKAQAPVHHLPRTLKIKKPHHPRTVTVKGVQYERQRTPGKNDNNCLIYALAQALGVDCDEDLAQKIRSGMLESSAAHKVSGFPSWQNPFRSVTKRGFLEPHQKVVGYILRHLLEAGGSTTTPEHVAVHIFNPDKHAHGAFQTISTSPHPSPATTHLYLHNDYFHFESMTPI